MSVRCRLPLLQWVIRDVVCGLHNLVIADKRVVVVRTAFLLEVSRTRHGASERVSSVIIGSVRRQRVLWPCAGGRSRQTDSAISSTRDSSGHLWAGRRRDGNTVDVVTALGRHGRRWSTALQQFYSAVLSRWLSTLQRRPDIGRCAVIPPVTEQYAIPVTVSFLRDVLLSIICIRTRSIFIMSLELACTWMGRAGLKWFLTYECDQHLIRRRFFLCFILMRT